MRKTLAALALLAAGPAFGLLNGAPAGATGLEVQVEGEANGTIKIDLFEDVAPKHVEQITALAEEGQYDGVVFHRVIDGFMAQTGDVEFGKLGGDMSMAGRGGSARPDLPAEFSDLPFDRGVVGMARAQNPNSANSQFFIMFDAGHFLNGQYTVVGKVTEGMDVVDAIKRGTGGNGAVVGQPDVMTKVSVTE
ncbi:peptidylprolyl isomerase [Leisingera sp. XS_AS12]|uniref:peptidylprolyl isomerase n=1 Tax=Leisingera sp. XS_AS12 TaxID=3241294 RepID=UPI0035197A0E